MTLLIADETWAILTLWQESRGETHEGRVAVGEVIRNRIARRYSSDGTVAGTVLRAYQWSGWNTADPNRIACAQLAADDPMVHECAQAWEESASSGLTHGALLYYNPRVVKAPAWVFASVLVATIGHHQFYVPANMHGPQG